MSYFWYQYKKLVVISLAIVVLGLLGVWGYNTFKQPTFEVQARNIDQPNLWGWAWTDTIGWISFNCLDTNQCGTGDSQYGVSFNRGANSFEGFAWSENVGWIAFDLSNVPGTCFSNVNESCMNDSDCSGRFKICNKLEPPNKNFINKCDVSESVNDCETNFNCIACYNEGENKIYGWALVLNHNDDGANDGWIKLSGDIEGSGDFSTTVYSYDDTDSSSDYTKDGDLNGWAWNGGTYDPGDPSTGTKKGLGWISFNSDDLNEASVDYRVTAKPTKPEISVSRTKGAESHSLTITWDEVIGEEEFRVLRQGAGGDEGADDLPYDNVELVFNEDTRNVVLDEYNNEYPKKYNDGHGDEFDPWLKQPLSRNRTYYYQIAACNIFGCNYSDPEGGATSRIGTISGLRINSVCYTEEENISYVNLQWNRPSTSVDLTGYEIEYCVLDAGQARNNCDDNWKVFNQSSDPGNCTNYRPSGNSTESCTDKLTGNRYSKRFNVHIYRVRAISDEKSCVSGDNSGDDCTINDTVCKDSNYCQDVGDGVSECSAEASNSDTVCTGNPGVCYNTDLCQQDYSSWGYFSPIRPCPRQGQPEYEEVRPE